MRKPKDERDGPAEMLHGTLELLILRVLEKEPLHGWGISRRIRELSDDFLQVNQGSLYPALYRLENKGLLEAERGVSDEGRRVKIYRLTGDGRRASTEERASWRRFAAAVEGVLEGAV